MSETYRIERLGRHGDGIAPGPIFAARTLPGELIEGELDGDRLERPRIIEPSPDRVSPDCSHYNACGACALLHLRDDVVSEWKIEVVRQALAARGLDAPITGVSTSPPASRRRAVLSARRTKSGALVGFHARASDAITDIPDCRVLRPEIVGARDVLSRMTVAGGSRKSQMSFTVIHGPSGLDVAATGGKPLDGTLLERLAEMARDANLARMTWNGEPVVTARPPLQYFGGISVVPPPSAFLQATEAGQRALLAAVSKALGGAGRIVDLFSGCGTFALPLSARAETHAVESDSALLEALDSAWRRTTGHRALRCETRDLFRRPLLPDELRGIEGVVIDPPRAGAEAQANQIAAADVPLVASVSCNPQTFARDAEILCASGYRIDWIRVVDQFRWSTHVELVAALSRH